MFFCGGGERRDEMGWFELMLSRIDVCAHDRNHERQTCCTGSRQRFTFSNAHLVCICRFKRVQTYNRTASRVQITQVAFSKRTKRAMFDHQSIIISTTNQISHAISQQTNTSQTESIIQSQTKLSYNALQLPTSNNTKTHT